MSTPYLKYAKMLIEKYNEGMYITKFKPLILDEIKKDDPKLDNFFAEIIFDKVVDIAAEMQEGGE